jgi:hypothetical protein
MSWGTRPPGTATSEPFPVAGSDVVRQQRHEDVSVRAAPTGDGVPARAGPVTADRPRGEVHGVVACRYVMEGPVVVGAAGYPVNACVDGSRVWERYG